MSCPRCPHCVASGAFGLIDKDDPALTTNLSKPANIHKADGSQFSVCGVAAYRYKNRRSGSSVDDWKDVTCPYCLKNKPGTPIDSGRHSE